MVAAARMRWLPDEATAYITAHGEITGSASDEFRSVLVTALMRRHPARIVVDLSDTSSLDSVSLGSLSAASDAASDLGIAFDIVGFGTVPGLPTTIAS